MSSFRNRMVPVVVSSHEDTPLRDLNWVYAHGNLESRMGWDCLCGSLEIKPGVHHCIFEGDGQRVDCLAFIWQDTTCPRLCGLVVEMDDVESIQHASGKMLQTQGC